MIWNLVHQASREIKRQAQGSGGILLRVVVGFHTTLARTILSISQSKHILKSLVDFFFFFCFFYPNRHYTLTVCYQLISTHFDDGLTVKSSGSGRWGGDGA